MDTTHPDAGKVIPQLQAKIDTCKYLERRTDQISYSLIYTGSFFDWVFRFPDAMGYDVPGHRATIYDGGDVEFEVTTVMRIGEAVAAVLAPEHRMETKNQHVFINSFTTTQNQVIAELEKVTGQKFAVAEEKLDGFRERAMQRTDVDPVELHMAVVLIGLCFAGPGGLALCSKDPRIGELWNKRLGLPEESFRNAVEEVVDSYKSASVTGAADSHQD